VRHACRRARRRALDVRDTLGGLDPRVIRPHAMRALLDDHVARRRDTWRELWALVLLQIWMEDPGCRSPAAAAPCAALRPVPRSPWPGRRSVDADRGDSIPRVARYLVDRSRQQSTLEPTFPRLMGRAPFASRHSQLRGGLQNLSLSLRPSRLPGAYRASGSPLRAS
jgi:hypothetical protein